MRPQRGAALQVRESNNVTHIAHHIVVYHTRKRITS